MTHRHRTRQTTGYRLRASGCGLQTTGGRSRLTPRLSFLAPRLAFSLVELLVVIGIIALLIGIIMPTIGNARTEAKRSSVKQMLASMDKGLELFNTDFRQYPNSSVRGDPLKMPFDSSVPNLNGAHWLSRALVGHDGNGLDYSGQTLDSDPGMLDPAVFQVADPDSGKIAGPRFQRRSVYIQKPDFATDSTIGMSGGPQTQRFLLRDIFQFPILYYRANPRAPASFSFNGADTGNSFQGAPGDKPGKYNLLDNAAITGAYKANAQPPTSYDLLSAPGWNLVNTGNTHGLGVFGNTINPKSLGGTISPGSPAPVGRTFVDFLSDPNAIKASGTLKPVNETSFILISAGPDGLYGTPDDVTNFK